MSFASNAQGLNNYCWLWSEFYLFVLLCGVFFLRGGGVFLVVSGMRTHPVPRPPSCKAEVSKEILVSTLGIKGTIYIRQNKPVLSFQLCIPVINRHSTCF